MFDLKEHEKLMNLTIPELVERYNLRLESIGGTVVLNVGETAKMRMEHMEHHVLPMTKKIMAYLEEQGAPRIFTPEFVRKEKSESMGSLDGLRQNVVCAWYLAEFYNRNGCLEQRKYYAQSLAEAEKQAAADAQYNNLALHDVRRAED